MTSNMTLTCLSKAQSNEIKNIRKVKWFNFYIIDKLQHKETYKYLYCGSLRTVSFELDHKMNLHLIYKNVNKVVKKERIITKRGKIYDK